NAGQNPPLLYRAGPDRLDQLGRTGMALGVVADTPFEQRTLHLGPGDFVLLYTDGVTDAADAQVQAFGLERLREVILVHRRTPAHEIVAALEQAISNFTGSAAPFDDVAIVAIRRL